MRPFPRYLLAAAALVAACSSIPEEYQPIIDSLHTPEMEAAIRAARQPATPQRASRDEGMQP